MALLEAISPCADSSRGGRSAGMEGAELVRIRLLCVRQITVDAAHILDELHLFEVGGKRIRGHPDGIDGGVPGLFGRGSRLFSRLSGSLSSMTRSLSSMTRILCCRSRLFSSHTRGLGGLARRFALLPDVIECSAILLLMLTGLFRDPPDAFGFASRSLIHGAVFLSDSKVVLIEEPRAFPRRARALRFDRLVRGVIAFIRHELLRCWRPDYRLPRRMCVPD